MALGDPTPHPLREVASGIASDIQELLKGEIALARAEFDQKLRGIIIAAVLILGGALVAFAGLVVVLEGGAAVLSFWLPTWASLLIVGIVILMVGGLISRAGIGKLSLKAIKPERTIASLQADVHMIKDHR